MLGKLLKHEFLHTGRVFLWLLGVGVAAGGIGALFTLNQDIGTAQFLGGLLWNLLLIFVAMFWQFIGLIAIIVVLTQSLFSNRGYLTFALPTSSAKLLLAKYTGSVAFMLLNAAQGAAMIFVALSNFRRLFERVGDVFVEQAGMEDMRGAFEGVLDLPSFVQVLRFGGFALLVMIALLVLMMTAALFVITVSHVRPFQEHPFLWGFFLFTPVSLGLGVVAIKYIGDFIKINVPLRFGAMGASETINLNLTVALVMVGLTALFFFLTNWLMKRKISLK